jgi:MerR family transcriptional regulator, copper efflux regulator
LAADPADGVGSELVPIDEVARRFGLRASAIRYYEARGLLHPVARHAGRRWYGRDELRRLAIIRYWQESGLMSLEEIGDILAGPTGTRGWNEVVRGRIDALREQIDRMEAASDHLEHILSFHRDVPPDGCQHFESFIWERPTSPHR